MNEIRKKNLELIKKNIPELYKKIIKLDNKKVEIIQAKSGLPTAKYFLNQESFLLHSKFNPKQEANSIIENSNLKADHIFLFGLGLGYLLTSLIEKKKHQCRVMVIEPDIEVIDASLNHLDWEIMLREDVFFFIGFDDNQLSSSITSFFSMKTFEVIETIKLPSTARIHKKYFNELIDIIDKEVKTVLYDFRTRLAEGGSVFLSIISNLPYILETRALKTLENFYKGVNGFIISAGPSLDKNIDYLKKVKNRGVIIAVDTALKPLIKRGIQPHFTVVADPSYLNYEHLMGVEESYKGFVVAESGVAQQIFKDYTKNIFTATLNKPLSLIIANAVGGIGLLPAWGSVVSMAMLFASYIGLKNVFFMGQDFAYTDKHNHCKGTTWEDKWLQSGLSFAQLQRKERSTIDAIDKSEEVKAVYDKKVLSSDRLLLYKNFLLNMIKNVSDTNFFNSTGGGALVEIPHKEIEEVLKEYIYTSKPISFNSLNSFPIIGSKRNKESLKKVLKSKHLFFKSYHKKVNKIIKELKELNLNSDSPEFIINLAQEAENLKNNLYKEASNGELLEMWSQKPIYNYLRNTNKLDQSNVDIKYIESVIKISKEYFEEILPITQNLRDSLLTAINSF